MSRKIGKIYDQLVDLMAHFDVVLDYSDEDLEALVVKIEEAYDELEVDAQRGEQPLYPIVFSVE